MSAAASTSSVAAASKPPRPSCSVPRSSCAQASSGRSCAKMVRTSEATIGWACRGTVASRLRMK
jgi:hypothetical protein